MSIIRRQQAPEDPSNKIIIQNLLQTEEESLSPQRSPKAVRKTSSLIKHSTASSSGTIQLKPVKRFESENTSEKLFPNNDTPEKQIELDLTQPLPDSDKQQGDPQKNEPEPELPTREDILAELNTFREQELERLKQEISNEINQLRQSELASYEEEKKKAKDSAYNEGYQEGYKKGEEKLSGLAKEAMQTINTLSKERQTLLKQSEKESLELGFLIAEKVIQTQLDRDATVFQNILSEALGRITDKERVIIKVNKRDIDFVRSYKQQFERELNDIKTLEIQEDHTIEIGGCVIETKLGYIDSSISTKLSIIEKSLDRVYLEEDGSLGDESELMAIDTTAHDHDLSTGLDDIDPTLL